jgi:hypothetical protein
MNPIGNVDNFSSVNRVMKETVKGDCGSIQSHVTSTQWDNRQGSVMKDEMLEELDCEDTYFEEC